MEMLTSDSNGKKLMKGLNMPHIARRSEKKEKVGTILDKEVVRMVKERAVKEGRTISDIIQDAILKYNNIDVARTEIRIQAAKRFCSKPFNLKTSDLNGLLNEDYYEV